MNTGDASAPAPVATEAAIEVRQAVLDDLVAHARVEAPNECCGMLVGTEGRIERSVRARNTVGSPTRYQIDPRDQIAAIRSARERGETVLGFYHSHPSSAPTPSATDRTEAAYPGHCYLIVSPGTPAGTAEVRGFRLHVSGNFLPLALVPIP
jgi:proteasome lid subunit RPN8/RPN11